MSFLNCRIVEFAAVATIAIATAQGVRADVVVLQPGADTSLIEIAPDANLGGADFFNAGTAGNGYRNRALLWFDIASQVPVGALIQSVTLTLDIVRQPASGWEAALFGLHRIESSWSEGDKIPEDGSPGLGAPATDGEATWVHRFLGGETWSAPGGQLGIDFAAGASSTAFVFGIGDPVMFEGTADLLADVQWWVDNPGANFGWMMMTETEEVRKSARSFASREHETGGPQLAIEYTVVPEPGTGMLLASGFVMLGWMMWRRSTRR